MRVLCIPADPTEPMRLDTAEPASYATPAYVGHPALRYGILFLRDQDGRFNERAMLLARILFKDMPESMVYDERAVTGNAVLTGPLDARGVPTSIPRCVVRAMHKALAPKPEQP